jgi:S1-C subfamily serine protease
VVSVLPVMPPERYRAEEPEGSGVVVHDGRYVVTALHVVDGAETVFVRSRGGEIVEARFFGSDPYTDLAVLEMDVSMPPVRFGGDPALGVRVCAVGNAFGLDLSVSCGVVSGVHRAGVGFNRIEDFVQTDAAVNPGASGGALLDEEWQVVGILSAIFTQESDANIGVNFAVAAPLAERVVSAIIEEGGYLPIQAGLSLERDPPAGQSGRLAALVVDVAADSPGARAGFREGDRIIRAADRRVRKPADLISAMARLSGRSEIVIGIERAGRELDLRLSVVEPAGAPVEETNPEE